MHLPFVYWDQAGIPIEDALLSLTGLPRILKLSVVLLLTGSIQGLKNQVYEYLQDFRIYDWLWKEGKACLQTIH